MPVSQAPRRLSAGVELQSHDVADVRVWAPSCQTVDFVVDDRGPTHPLHRDANGCFSGSVPDVKAGSGYWFCLDGKNLRPDPVSRYQPDGPHGRSVIIDPSEFIWSDAHWRGLLPHTHVIYEMHVGTFTSEGTWRAAAREFDELAAAGITTIEMMPIADFSGRFGWGYDGVNLYAPTRLYGEPDDLRAFIDRAHGAGLAVILDVVYNHLGPDGNYLDDFSPSYFTDRYRNDWGRAINFEGPPQARALFVENAGYWIDEFHFDGLRFDATQNVQDASGDHVLAEMVRRARHAAGSRRIYLVAENEPQETMLVRPPESGGFGLDALWNDDFHHTAFVALTGRREAYYTDYTGSPQELISCAKYGYLYQGQWYGWQKQRRGTPGLDLPGHAFISYLENHDQVANSLFGRRLHQLSSPGRHRAMSMLTLLGPATPMLFQGQEFSSSAPFLYFADHGEELRGPVVKGRREFLSQFTSVADPEAANMLASPVEEDTFKRSKLNFAERATHSCAYAFHRDLLKLRRSEAAITRPDRVDGAVLGSDAFVLRFFSSGGDRLMVVNLGRDVDLLPAAEPLLAAPAGQHWSVLCSTESVRYGGQGTSPLRPNGQWHVPGESAVLLGPKLAERDRT